MSDREQILGRIRRALQVPAPRPGNHTAREDGQDSAHPAPPLRNQLPIINNPAPAVREWLPRVGESWEEQVALFAANAADLKAEFHLLKSPDELVPHMLRLKAEGGWGSVATHAGEWTHRACAALDLPIVTTNGDCDAATLERCDAGITCCEALVAQTGSVLITNVVAGGRVLSALIPHHIVLATRAQLVPDLAAAFALLREKYGGNYPSLISFITGPSRTGDIERILVLGAHGPKRLTIFCV